MGCPSQAMRGVQAQLMRAAGGRAKFYPHAIGMAFKHVPMRDRAFAVQRIIDLPRRAFGSRRMGKSMTPASSPIGSGTRLRRFLRPRRREIAARALLGCRRKREQQQAGSILVEAMDEQLIARHAKRVGHAFDALSRVVALRPGTASKPLVCRSPGTTVCGR